jgi:hypothetical protein
MSPKPLSALAAVMAAVAVVVATASASASAATHGPPARSHVRSTPSTVVCGRLSQEIGAALRAGNPTLATALARTFVYMGCGGAAL